MGVGIVVTGVGAVVRGVGMVVTARPPEAPDIRFMFHASGFDCEKDLTMDIHFLPNEGRVFETCSKYCKISPAEFPCKRQLLI